MNSTEVRALPGGNVEVVITDGEVTVGVHYTKNNARKVASLILQASGDPLYRDVRDIADYKRAQHEDHEEGNTAAG